MKHSAYITYLCCSCILLVTLFLFPACKKNLQVPLPIDKLTAGSVFTTDELATSAVLGLYAQMMPTTPFFSNGGTTIFAGLSADELYLPLPEPPDEMEFYQNSLSAANSTVWSYFWYRAYRHIYHINACLEGLESATTLTPAVKQRLLGEVKFSRAFCYFYLVNFYGAVPLVTSTAYNKNASLPRAPATAVWQQVITDLEEARNLLPAAYPTPGRVRPNKWAATALLARSYLYTKAWAEAEEAATALINSGVYSLLPKLEDVFGANSSEAIWQLAPVEAGFNTTEARYLIPTSAATAKPNYAITPGLFNSFEPGDARRPAWIGIRVVAGEPVYYAFKYKVRANTLVTENNTVLRYAEQWLIRAEARAQQGKADLALLDLNTIRKRAGLPPLGPADQNALLLAIEKERRAELFVEWGHRWFDLLRTGRAGAVLGPVKPAWKETAALFPLFQQELLRNPNLTQNPGY